MTRESDVDLAPEHAPPGVVSLEDGVEPLQLGLAELCVVEEPPLVLRQQPFPSSRASFNSTEYCNMGPLIPYWCVFSLYNEISQRVL